jgi:short-subunit dehydrogenase
VALARAAAAVSAWLHNVPAGPVLLVNNAGLGAFGRFPGDDPARQLAIIDVNVRAVVDLTARLLPVLRVRGGGEPRGGEDGEIAGVGGHGRGGA